MHYKNGREAKVGDRVVRLDSNSKPDLVGILVQANPGSTTCNGQIVPLPAATQYATLGECLHADDVAIPAAPPTPAQ